MNPSQWTDEEYFADREYVRKGWLDKITLQPEMGGSPACFKAYIDGAQQKSTAAMEFGSAFHGAVLENKQLMPVHATRRGTKAYEAEASMILESDAQATPLPVKDYDRAMFMKEALNNPQTPAAQLANQMLFATPGMNEFIFHGETEVAAPDAQQLQGALHFSLPGETYMVRVKAKVDRACLHEDKLVVIDLKTSANASPYDFSRSCAKYRYIYQQAYYGRVVRRWLAGGNEFDFETPAFPDFEHYLIVVQSDRSGTVAVYKCDQEDLVYEHAQMEEDLGLYGLCNAHNYWPPATCNPSTIRLPAWYRRNNG
jgi:hypothetical protein